jgi:hypothetical protein
MGNDHSFQVNIINGEFNQLQKAWSSILIGIFSLYQVLVSCPAGRRSAINGINILSHMDYVTLFGYFSPYQEL